MTSRRRWAWPAAVLAAGQAIFLAGVPAAPAAGQELPLKREVPELAEPDPCAEVRLQARDAPDEGEREELERLRTEASRARILGETARARELLERALSLDPADAELHFELGRLLDDQGRDGALDAFCRYLALDPEGAESGEARARVERLAPDQDQTVPEAARRAFQEGVVLFEQGDPVLAAREFSRAIVEAPEWADAHYNRAVAYLAAGRARAAVPDLERYLELNPRSADAHLVREHLHAVAPPPPVHSPAAAFAMGMVVPGLGHFYTGRTGMGAFYLLGAGAAALTGVLYTEVEVDCLDVPGPEGCPPEQVLERREEQPYLLAGLGAAAGLTLAGALHAYLDARSSPSRHAARSRSSGITLVGPGDARLWLGVGRLPGEVRAHLRIPVP